MKIIQVNAWLGHLIQPLLEFIGQEKPDIVCAQEVLNSKVKNPIFNTTYQMNDSIAQQFAHHSFSPTYAFEALGEKVELGNAIYSNIAITRNETYFVSGRYNPLQTIKGFKHNIRNLQISILSLGARSLIIANHHGFHDVDPNGNEQTAVALTKVASHLKGIPAVPFIFCGDLNVTSTSRALAPLNSLGLRNLTVEQNIPTTLSPIHYVKSAVACDYILVNDMIKVANFHVSDALISDHRALILEFDV